MGKRKIIEIIEKIKIQIEFHLEKLDNDLKNKDFELGFYHFKEFKKSFFPFLLRESEKINQEEQTRDIIKSYEERLEKILKEYNCLEDFKKKFDDKFA